MYKILIVEDDRTISELVKKHLLSWGYDAECVYDFKAVMLTFIKYNPQLVLMDISLPFYNGYHWCGEIRKISVVPVVFISSLSDNMNIVMAMNMGGDDFITKPFSFDVLTAKINAVLRRTYDFSAQTNFIEHRGAILNTDSAELIYNGEKLELSKNEYRILFLLMSGKGSVISRDEIMMKLWETDNFIDENTLSVNINRLRKKLTEVGLCDFIKTKKGMGYIIE
jgi:Response regulators consisting of a CheY-like receiver domain and a winged-helix DNA-binding domain